MVISGFDLEIRVLEEDTITTSDCESQILSANPFKKSFLVSHSRATLLRRLCCYI